MTTSVLSPKFQIVIPKEIRRHLGLKPGQRLQVRESDGRIELVPLLEPEQLIGLLKGPEPLEFKRDGNRRV